MKRIQKFLLKFKNANFEQSLIVLIGVFLLGVIFVSLTTSGTGPSQTINPGSGNVSEPEFDPNQIMKSQKNLFSYKHGTIEVDGTIGTYFFQEEPTEEQIALIKSTLGLVSLELVDETYKTINRTNPIEPVFPDEPVLDLPRTSQPELPEDGIGEDAIVD